MTNLVPIPGAPKVVTTHVLQDRPDEGTHIEIRVGKPKPRDKALVDQIAAKYKEEITKAIGNLRLMLEGR